MMSAPISAYQLHNQVDQLDVPYTTYCSSYLAGFDTWEPVTSNQRLPGVLSAFSESNPPPVSETWTLDTLLALPRTRIRYYQKLYNRLLKNSAPGRSTDKKLIEANEKLERLSVVAEERSAIPLPGSDHVIETTDEVVIDTRDKPEVPLKIDNTHVDDRERSSNHEVALTEKKPIFPREPEIRTSVESSTRGSVLSSRFVRIGLYSAGAHLSSAKPHLVKRHCRLMAEHLQERYQCRYQILSVVLLWSDVAISLQ